MSDCDRSKVTVSLPLPRFAERFPVTPLMVTALALPLIVVPAAGVIRILFAAGWLIVKLTAPLSVRVKLPPTRLVATFASIARCSSDSNRQRTDFRDGARLRRWLLLI